MVLANQKNELKELRAEIRRKKRKQLAESFTIEGNHRANVFASVICVGESSLWAAVAAGKLPKPLKLGMRTSVWSGELIERTRKEGFAPVGTYSEKTQEVSQ